MLQGCYEETGPVEFKLNPAAVVAVTGRPLVRQSHMTDFTMPGQLQSREFAKHKHQDTFYLQYADSD